MTTTITFLTQAWNILFITQVDSVGSCECITPEIKSHSSVWKVVIVNNCQDVVNHWSISCWYSFLLTVPSQNPFIAHSLGHIFVACQRKVSLPQSQGYNLSAAETHVFQVSRKYVASISCPLQCDDKEKVEHERKTKTITHRHSTWVSD